MADEQLRPELQTAITSVANDNQQDTAEIIEKIRKSGKSSTILEA